MKRYRVSFCEQIDADLLRRIEAAANGGSESDALRFLIRHWFENEKRAGAGQMWPNSGQDLPAPALEEDDLEMQIEGALNALDGEW